MGPRVGVPPRRDGDHRQKDNGTVDRFLVPGGAQTDPEPSPEWWGRLRYDYPLRLPSRTQ